MAIVYIIALLLLIVVPSIFTYLRRGRAQKRAGGSTSILPPGAEVVVSPPLEPEATPAGRYPAKENTPQSDAEVKQVGSIREIGRSFEPPKTPTPLSRIEALPPLKRAILWSEILKAPRGLEPPE